MYFQGKFIPFKDAKIGVMTHAFNYGTGVFEGIRGYWNKNKKQLYILKLKEHNERLLMSCKAIKIDIKKTLDELEKITIEVVKRNGYKQDVYIRPIAYKSQEQVGLGLTGLQDDFLIYLAPFGDYLDTFKGIKTCVSSWHRVNEKMIPEGAKITGLYINSSLAKAEAKEKGYDEAIMLNHKGNVAEGSGENIFIVKNGEVITPHLSSNILAGITRRAVIGLLKEELKLKVIEGSITKDELYSADEIFFSGTGAQVVAVSEVDGKKIGTGSMGEVTSKLQKIYFGAVRGENPKYSDWLTPVY
ncbi:branched-chain amino acid transaminase [Candidatus Margulisiibacteriota bacterium]